MPEERQRYEKEEKDEKEEKGRDEKGGGSMEEKWRRDPLSGIFTGLVVIGVGIVLLLASQGTIGWSDLWPYILLVVGCAFIIEALLRVVMPAYRRPVLGKMLVGVILIAIGATNIYNIGAWWPLIIIGVGVIILFSVFSRFIRPRK